MAAPPLPPARPAAGFRLPRRFAGPRAAAGLLWGLALFAGAQAGLAVLMDTALPKLRDPEFGCRLDAFLRLRAAEPDRPVVVVLGTSRTAFGFRPGALAGCRAAGGTPPLVFNFAFLGCGPTGQLLNLRRLLDRGVRPDWVLVECWPPFMHDVHQVAQETLYADRLSWSDLRLVRRYLPAPALLYDRWWAQRVLPCFSNRLRLLELYAPGWVPWESRDPDWYWNDVDPTGWLPFLRNAPSERVRQRQWSRNCREYTAMLNDFHLSGLADRALRDLLATCRREGIHAALFFMPESSPVRGWYPAPLRGKLDRYFRGLAGRYGVPVIDTRDWAPDGAFADGLHLAPDGARDYSVRFGREVLGPLLQGAACPALLRRF